MLNPTPVQPVDHDGFAAMRGSLRPAAGAEFFHRFMVFVGPGYLVATG
ncbi:MAG TPA: hypothetical protein VMU18_04685 [Rhodoblastus sp.]|nr:hypothetical protein [Rhodoblastus sp.]